MAKVSSMRGGRSRKFKSEINVVPYIDVMLVLLVIFMVVAPLSTPSMINLPKAGKSNQPPTEYLEIELKPVRGPDGLGLAVNEMMKKYDLVFIDSPGLNPFSQHDMDFLKALVNAADVEPILVLAAGGDTPVPADAR